MGVFEIEGSSKGTFAVAKAVADGNALSIIGGGDSVKSDQKEWLFRQGNFHEYRRWGIA